MNDDPNALVNRIKRTLDQRAATHPERDALCQQVYAATRPRRFDALRHQLAAFTLAAMVSGLMIIPAPLTSTIPDHSAMLMSANAALQPPQTIEDLEMLQVLGIDEADSAETVDVQSPH
ncbi:MAG: hypothetical protein RLY58_1371 [Pseudomonadota bacterium]|jgi:hypothetical protein